MKIAPVRVVDTREVAEKTFEVFHKRPMSEEIPVADRWPARMQEVGIGQAELYRSNKWKKDLRKYEEYKHIVEASRSLYVEPGWLREWGNPKRQLSVIGPMVTCEGPMPQYITRLGPLLGLQVRLYREGPDGEPYVPGGDENLYEIVASRAYLAAGHYPGTGEVFLVVYDAGGIRALLTGDELDVREEGIVG